MASQSAKYRNCMHAKVGNRFLIDVSSYFQQLNSSCDGLFIDLEFNTPKRSNILFEKPYRSLDVQSVASCMLLRHCVPKTMLESLERVGKVETLKKIQSHPLIISGI